MPIPVGTIYQILAADIIDVRLISTLHGQQIINTFKYQLDVDVNTGQDFLLDLCATIRDSVEFAGIFNGLSNQFSTQTVEAQKIYPLRFQKVGVSVTPPQGVGGVAGEAVPSSVAVVTSRQGVVAGRSHYGRVFWAGLPSAYSLSSEIDPAVFPGAASAFNDLVSKTWEITAFSALVRPVIWSPADPENSDLLTVVRTDNVLRNQRRRQVRRGI